MIAVTINRLLTEQNTGNQSIEGNITGKDLNQNHGNKDFIASSLLFLIHPTTTNSSPEAFPSTYLFHGEIPRTAGMDGGISGNTDAEAAAQTGETAHEASSEMGSSSVEAVGVVPVEIWRGEVGNEDNRCD